jgi:glycine/D-amino acid oxidase-like deaminating enzyme
MECLKNRTIHRGVQGTLVAVPASRQLVSSMPPDATAPPVNTPAWDAPGWDPLPPLPGSLAADVCVVGLGGTGLAAVRGALDRRLAVAGIDAGAVAGGAAGRNGGFLLTGLAAFHHRARASLGRDRARRLYECTVEELDRLAAETPAAVRRVGSLRLATTPEEWRDCEEHLAALREDGLPGASYLGPEGRGILIPADAAFNPLQRCRELATRLIARGARLYERTPALAVAPGEVHTPAGTVRAGVIVLASDGNLTRLVPSLADRVYPVRLQMLATAPAPEVTIRRPVYARFGMEYWQQLADRRITLGGFRDLNGDDDLTGDLTPTGTVQAALENFLRGTIGVRAPVTHRWAATVSYTREGILPVLEEVQPGVWAMGAYNGTGNLIGPLCARAALELAMEGRSEVGGLLGRAVSGKQ